MLARAVRGLGLDAEQMVERLEPLYGDIDEVEPAERHEMRSLAEWMAAKGGDEGFSSLEERRRAVGSLLQRMSRDRALLIRLDDVQWGRETLDTVRSLMDADFDVAALIVMNAEEGTASRGNDTAEVLQAIVGHASGSHRTAGELTFDDQARLAEEVLGLEPELARDVAERTGGHPMMAVQLVGDWVEQGVLEPGASGFTAPPDVDLSVPDSAREIWQRRIERVWREYPESDRGAARAALEMAAVFGQSLTQVEWKAITRAVGLEEPDQLLDLLSRRGLIEQDEAGWSFAHDKLRQQLERHADSEGRLDVYHRTCADLLGEMYSANEPGLASRVAAHRIAGRDLKGALQPIREVVRRAMDAGDMEAVETWLDRRQRAMDELDLAPTERARVEQLVLAGEAAAEAGRPGIAKSRAEEAIELAGTHDYTSVRGDAHRLRATLRRAESRFSAGLRDCHRALKCFEQAGDTEGIARACYETARICRLLGEADKAENYFQRAMERFEELGGENMQAMITSDLGSVWVMKRAFGQAERALRVGLSMAQERGNRKVASASWNRLGDVERHRDNLDRAGRYYRRAATLARSRGAKRQTALTRIMLALEEGRVEWANEALQRVTSAFDSDGIDALTVHLLEAWVAAEHEDWESYDDALQTVIRLLDERDLVDVELPWLALRAGRAAGLADQTALALDMLAIAVDQWRKQGEEERARELVQLMQKMG
jgi:tetratricopeptide (TPR) repeat protein